MEVAKLIVPPVDAAARDTLTSKLTDEDKKAWLFRQFDMLAGEYNAEVQDRAARKAAAKAAAAAAQAQPPPPPEPEKSPESEVLEMPATGEETPK
jgi:hypothetical protein